MIRRRRRGRPAPLAILAALVAAAIGAGCGGPAPPTATGLVDRRRRRRRTSCHRPPPRHRRTSARAGPPGCRETCSCCPGGRERWRSRSSRRTVAGDPSGCRIRTRPGSRPTRRVGCWSPPGAGRAFMSGPISDARESELAGDRRGWRGAERLAPRGAGLVRGAQPGWPAGGLPGGRLRDEPRDSRSSSSISHLAGRRRSRSHARPRVPRRPGSATGSSSSLASAAMAPGSRSSSPTVARWSTAPDRPPGRTRRRRARAGPAGSPAFALSGDGSTVAVAVVGDSRIGIGPAGWWLARQPVALAAGPPATGADGGGSFAWLALNRDGSRLAVVRTDADGDATGVTVHAGTDGWQTETPIGLPAGADRAVVAWLP